MAIAENIAGIRERIVVAAPRAGRSPDQIALMAVSKTQPPERIREAYAAGQRLFGENRVQEFAGKAAALADLLEAEWHMIGHLQTNKAGKAVELFGAVDSVDSVKLAEKLDAAARGLGKRLSVLVEINVGGEEAKSGVAPDSRELEELLLAAPRLEALEFRGLMTVPRLRRILSERGLTSAGCANCGMRLRRGSCLASPWTSFRWACHTTSKWRWKRVRPACGLEQPFLGKEQRLNHRGHRGHGGTP